MVWAHHTVVDHNQLDGFQWDIKLAQNLRNRQRFFHLQSELVLRPRAEKVLDLRKGEGLAAGRAISQTQEFFGDLSEGTYRAVR
jgi:hypothetical protein